MQISEQVKERLDIVEFISNYIKLNKSGSNFKGLCPFHHEKTPSFMVSQEKQIWHCFGCNEGGDIFKFLMKYENLEFIDALKVLAKRAGIEMVKQDPKIESQLAKLYNICEKATDFFSENLKNNSDVGKYLKERGLTGETAKEWRLGFANTESDSIFQFLTKDGFLAEDIVITGLAIKSTKYNNSYFDRFRSRIIFPIADNSGRVVGFTGRIFGREENPKEPKYLNSPETPIFNKRKILYGFSENKKAIREKDEVFLVEGQMDFLMAWQAGLKNVVASSGTALTEEQLKLLRRLSKKLIIGYDMDEAGRMATERAVDMAKQLDFQTDVLILPKGNKDLADYLIANENDISKLSDGIFESGQYYYSQAFDKIDKNNLEEKNKAINFFLTKLSKTVSPIEKSHWISKISKDLDIKPEYIEEELRRIINEEKIFTPSLVDAVKERRAEANIFCRPRIDILSDQILSLALRDDKIRVRLIEVKEYLDEEKLNLAELIMTSKDFPNENLEKIGYLQLLGEYEFNEDENLEKEFEETVSQLRREILKEQIERKHIQIKEAEKSGNGEELKKHMEKYAELLEKASEF